MQLNSGLRFLHNIPHPCMVDFFTELHSRSIDLTVYFQSRHHTERPWPVERDLPFPHEFLPGRMWHIGGRPVQTNSGIRRIVADHDRRDWWILSGYLEPTLHLIAGDLNRKNIPWILLNESPYKNLDASSFRDFVRRVALRPVRRAKGIIVFGPPRDGAYFAARFPTKPVLPVPQLLDTQNLNAIAAKRKPRLSESSTIRALFCGQWEPAKRADVLFEIALEFVHNNEPVEFSFVGKGSLSEYFHKRAATDGRGRIWLHESLDKQHLLEEYEKANVVVQPVRNQGWGMTVTEGLAAGLPVIASHGVGAAEGLIVNGQNGFLFEADDIAGMKDYLRLLIHDRARLEAMTATAIQNAPQINIKVGVDKFLEAFETIRRLSGLTPLR